MFSVLLCVYNGEDTIKNTVLSVLKQTYFDFEFIIIDDGSTDSTNDIVEELASLDKRIINFKKENTGLTSSLNFGLYKCNRKYVARIDADDIWYENKLMIQYKFLSINRELILLGTGYDDYFDNDNISICNKFNRKLSDAEVRTEFNRGNPFLHSSVVFSRERIISIGAYDTKFKCAQDYELWRRCLSIGQVALIPDILVSRYCSKNSISQKQDKRQRFFALKTKISYLFDTNFKEFNVLSILKDVIFLCSPSFFVDLVRKFK